MGKKTQKGRKDKNTGEIIPSEIKILLTKDPELKVKQFVEFYRVN